MRHETKAQGGYTIIIETTMKDGWCSVRREVVAPLDRDSLAADDLKIGPFPTEDEAAVAGIEHCNSWIAHEMARPIEDDEL